MFFDVGDIDAPNDAPFWKNEEGKVTILRHMLLEFLERNGVGNMQLPDGNTILVQTDNQIIRKLDRGEISRGLVEYVKSKNVPEVLEKFHGGLQGHVNSIQLDTLRTLPAVTPADTDKEVWLYFENAAVRITATSVELVEYTDLPHQVWQDQILDRTFVYSHGPSGQFANFLANVAGGDPERIEGLMSAVGYLLSRYQDPSNPKAIILTDEKSTMGIANGGTGKSLLAKGVGKLRNVVTIDGKHYKPSDPFCNQRIDITTSVVCFDDMRKNFNLEDIYSMITSGVTVNRKHKDAYYIEPEYAPKVMIGSNHAVKGPAGNADLRRRWEFELAPFYGPSRQPQDEFGNLFFSGWDQAEWKRFDRFMVECVMLYLKQGLLPVKGINLVNNRLIAETSSEFVEFMKNNLALNTKMDQRDMLNRFKAFSDNTSVSAHAFHKLLQTYADYGGFMLEKKSSGGNYHFWMMDTNPKDPKGDEHS